MIHLARHGNDGPIPGSVIAEATGVPTKYLSKILSDLVRTGLLDSARGKSGGFSLRKPAKRIRLIDIIAPYEQLQTDNCPFGNQRCSDRNPCLAHDRWKRVVQAEKDFLTRTTLDAVSFEVSSGNRRARAQRQ